MSILTIYLQKFAVYLKVAIRIHRFAINCRNHKFLNVTCTEVLDIDGDFWRHPFFFRIRLPIAFTIFDKRVIRVDAIRVCVLIDVNRNLSIFSSVFKFHDCAIRRDLNQNDLTASVCFRISGRFNHKCDICVRC